MSAGALLIARTGLACPVGLRSAPALAAIRAGVNRFVTPDERPEVTVCRLTTLPPEAPRAERMGGLVEHALSEALEDPPGRWPDAIPLFISLPPAGSGAPFDEAAVMKAVRAKVAAATGAQLHIPESAVVREGRSGIFTALQQAAVVLPRGRFPLALVVAVDSQVDPRTLAVLGRQGLLLDSINLDGRVVGEAAAAFVVTPPAALHPDQALATIAAIETDHDAESFTQFHQGQSINHAYGLARVLRRLAGVFSGRAGVVVTGQPSEGYWGRELSYAYLRNVAMMPEPFEPLTTGTEIGDAGAAAGAIALHRALGEISPGMQGQPPGRPNALVYAVSDDGRIGALALFPAGPRA